MQKISGGFIEKVGLTDTKRVGNRKRKEKGERTFRDSPNKS